MNQPAEEDDNASLARNVAILSKRMDAEVVRLRKHLDEWIGYSLRDVEISIVATHKLAALKTALLGKISWPPLHRFQATKFFACP
jgi:hypothetical protein